MNGQRTYAQYGMSQSLPLGKRWTIDATLDAMRYLDVSDQDLSELEKTLAA